MERKGISDKDIRKTKERYILEKGRQREREIEMIVKRIYTKDKSIQWFECDFVVKMPADEKKVEKFILY